MSQCHDSYLSTEMTAPPPVPDVAGTQCHDQTPDDRTQDGQTQNGQTQNPDRGGLTVLIADSDPVIRAGLRRLLESDDRFAAIWEVAAGDEAVAQAPAVDLVLVDLKACNGLGALGAIGQLVRPHPHAPVVALGRQGEEWLEMAARQEGAVDIIEWPDDGVDLRNRLVLAAQQVG